MTTRFAPLALVALAACSGGNDASPESPPAPAPSGYTSISAVQGNGPASPYAGQRVTVRGVVSGDFQDDDADEASNLGGFFIQSLTADADPATSEGLFVFDRHADDLDVAVGDIVIVTGNVSERFGETQLEAATVSRDGTATVTAVNFSLPAASVTRNSDGDPIADLEAYEGMRVRIEGEMFVQDLSRLERFGEIGLSTEEREFQFTARSRPDPAGYTAHAESVAARTLMLDDGRAEQNVQPVRYVGAHEDRAPRLGDAVTGVEGVLRYSRGSGPHGTETWRLMPTVEPAFEARNPRPSDPAVQAELVVASLNLLNYFSTVDDGTPACGPQQDQNCRGADTPEELERQRLRTAEAVNRLGADVVGLMELENNPRASIEDLLAALNADGADWRHVDTGTIGDDAIRVALIYRAARATPVGPYALLDGSVDARFNDDRNRPVLAQTFASGDGSLLTVAVAHLKSKGSPCDEDGDPDRNDGQGNCAGTRTAAAEALADWLLSDPTGSGDPDVLLTGDLNAYSMEDPLAALEAAGFENLGRSRLGNLNYSYAFRGLSGALDHALANASLAAQVTAVIKWHINADEAPLYDYNLDFGRDPSLFDATAPWRASDHDPVIIGFDLN